MIAHLVLPGPPRAAWTVDPVVAAMIGAAALLYTRGLRTLWDRHGPGRAGYRRQALAFVGGLAALGVALLSPVDSLADELLWAHMLQHLILVVVAAPLLVLGGPGLPFLLGLPLSWRLGLRRLTRPAWIRRAARWASTPAVVLALHVAALWAWHAPGPYQAAVEHPVIHAVEHLSFLGTAVLFWWVLFPQRGRRRLAQGADVLFVFLAGLQGGALGALFTFASLPLYPLYATRALAHGLTPLHDQQLAGLLMWIPTGIVYVGVAGFLFVRWLGSMERGLAPLQTVGPR